MKKHILKENYDRLFGKREFGDPLPTFEDVMEKHQSNESDKKVSEVTKSTCPKCGHEYSARSKEV